MTNITFKTLDNGRIMAEVNGELTLGWAWNKKPVSHMGFGECQESAKADLIADFNEWFNTVNEGYENVTHRFL